MCFDSPAPRARQSQHEHSPAEVAVAAVPVPPGTASFSSSALGAPCPALAIVSRAQVATGLSSPVLAANDRCGHGRGTSPAWNRDRGRCNSASRDRHRRLDRASRARAHPREQRPTSPGSPATTSTTMVSSAFWPLPNDSELPAYVAPQRQANYFGPCTATTAFGVAFAASRSGTLRRDHRSQQEGSASATPST
jgi:hypothetical protein